jgi:hypothetical protein
VIGFSVALLSQFHETIKTNSETEQAQLKERLARLETSNQVSLARQS